MEENRSGFKKKAKLIVKNNAFRYAHIVALKKLNKIVKKSSSPPVIKKDGKRIFFNMLYGMYGELIYWECGLAKAMQLRGHDVKVLICGKSLTMCTSEYTIKTVHDDKTCKHCVDFSKNFLKTVGLPYLNYNDYIKKEDIENIKNKVNKLSIEECKKLIYKDVPVGGLSLNATMRYFEGAIKVNEKFFEKVLKAELVNSLIATDIAEKFTKQEKPDVIVTTHLGYSSWGSFAKYCESRGIRICYPGGGYIKNTIIFDFNLKKRVNSFFKLFRKEVKNNQFINKKEAKELDSFIYKRVNAQEGDTKLYNYTNKDIGNQFNFNKYERTYAVFPNVGWDSSLLEAQKGFKDVYEWISYTIDFFKKHTKYQLIVKIHPSEAYFFKSKNTVSDFILKNYSPLTDNIKIIPPVTPISPYSLFPFIDTGIVYNGTIGLEMSLQKIPVIVAGITHYGNLGFTYDISSKEEYNKILKNKLPKLDDKQKNLARLYGYFYFVKSFVPCFSTFIK